MTNTSIGRGPASGGNENHDGDPRKTTLGEAVKQEPPAGGPLDDNKSQDPAGVAVDGVRNGEQAGQIPPA